MRLWSLHPSHLDSKGLVALWREALLAQAVLRDETKGYRRHPQLERFRAQDDPVVAIAAYLRGVFAESQVRGFNFDSSKIGLDAEATLISVTSGQLEFESRHLANKLRERDPNSLVRLEEADGVRAHPIFEVVEGPIASFERVQSPAL